MIPAELEKNILQAKRKVSSEVLYLTCRCTFIFFTDFHQWQETEEIATENNLKMQEISSKAEVRELNDIAMLP